MWSRVRSPPGSPIDVSLSGCVADTDRSREGAGTSIEPTIRDRDPLVIDTADQKLTAGRIYALVVDDTLLVKRIERTLRGQIFLRPDNSTYQTEELAPDIADAVRIRGQIIWHGGSLE